MNSQRSTVTVVDEESCSIDASWRHRWLKHENDMGVARGAVTTSWHYLSHTAGCVKVYQSSMVEKPIMLYDQLRLTVVS